MQEAAIWFNHNGCYSCPSKCNPYESEVFVRNFNDGSKVFMVYRKSALSLNGKSVGNIEFCLVINFIPSRMIPKQFPHSLLGLGNDIIPGHPPVLYQLYNSKLIPDLAFQICSPVPPLAFAGVLVLGSSQSACSIQQPVTILPLVTSLNVGAQSSTSLSYGLVSSRKRDAVDRPVDNVHVFFDTGTRGIALPNYIFIDVKEKLINFASRDSGRTVNAKVEKASLCVSFFALQYLPILTFSMGVKERPFQMKILPKEYLYECDAKWCCLRIASLGNHIILGRPFFASYFSGFDLKNAKLKIAGYK